jgi:DNA-binding NarL/FixJ family response regulator
VPSSAGWNNAVVSARRILIVDDHTAFLSSARALLAAEGCNIVACAVDGDEALATIGRVPIDVVLLDLYLPGIDGVAVAEQIAALDAPPAVILISSYEEAASEQRVAAAPVRGFLAKRDLTCAAIDRLLV